MTLLLSFRRIIFPSIVLTYTYNCNGEVTGVNLAPFYLCLFLLSLLVIPLIV